MSFPLLRVEELSELLPALAVCGGRFPNFVLERPADDPQLPELACAAAGVVDDAFSSGLDRFVLHLRLTGPVPPSLDARLRDLAAALPPLTVSQMWREPRRGWVQLHLPGTPGPVDDRSAVLDLSSAVPAADVLPGVPARPPAPAAPSASVSLAERLGFAPSDVVLLVNADDLGLCHAANDGVVRAMRDGVCMSASLMVPCPWARAAADATRGLDVGVHLTLNCEWSGYRWQPVSGGASLRDASGSLRASMESVWLHVDPAEAAVEMEAQLVRALEWGVDVTHLDAHMYTAQLTSPLFDAYLDLAARYRLPVRLRGSGPDGSEPDAAALHARAAAAGVLSTDHMVLSFDSTDPQQLEGLLPRLSPGVTELYLHPASDHPELRAFAPDWRRRVADRDVLLPGGKVASLLRGSGVQLVGWRELRDLQRRG